MGEYYDILAKILSVSREEIDKAILQLSQFNQFVLSCCNNYLSNTEIAKTIGKTTVTVSYYKANAILALASMLGQQGKTVQDFDSSLPSNKDVIAMSLVDFAELVDLSNRSKNLFKYSFTNIKTVGDLLDKSKKDLLKYRGLGIKTVYEIISSLSSFNLSLKPNKTRRQTKSDEVRQSLNQSCNLLLRIISRNNDLSTSSNTASRIKEWIYKLSLEV
jgi:DNA-directed RNA polymerase alpha subunit